MDRKLFAFIWRYSKRQQITILVITLVSFPILYMSLELPKWIVNQAIGGKGGFPKSVLGVPLDQVPYLVTLCVAFLALVVLNNVIKYVLNVYKGIAGERMVRRLRYMLYNQILRFRLGHFRRVSASEMIPMITAEVEDVGVFIGEAIATPAFQGGTLLVYLVFIFAQDPFLGAAAVSLYPLQGYIIPKMQRRVALLSRERVRNVRKISDRIGETIGGILEIHAHDTTRWHLADMSDRLLFSYRLRLEIYQRKFMIKFLNNFMNQLPPFFFYSVGGYLVIRHDLTFGALVAVLAAYKDLASPWKELLDYYQNLSNVSIKYETVVENFDPEDAIPPERLLTPAEPTALPAGDIATHGLSVSASGIHLDVSEVSATIPRSAVTAIHGADGSGRSELVLALAGLLPPEAGRIEIGGVGLETLVEPVLGRAMAYVGPDPYLFNDTIRSNVVYSLRHDPNDAPPLTPDDLRFRQVEATLTGNSLQEVSAPWEDFSHAGVEDTVGLDQRLLALFDVAGLGDDLYRLGLKSRLDPARRADLVDRVLTARHQIAERIRSDRAVGKLVTLWEPETFNPSATLAENVLFALPNDPTVKVEQIAADSDVLRILRDVGLAGELVEIGATVANAMIELFAGLDADSSLMGDYSFIAQDELPLFEAWLKLYGDGKLAALPAEAVVGFVGLAFRLVPARHRLVDLSDEQEARIVAARTAVRTRLAALAGRYAPFDPDAYVAPLTIEENILFGKPRVDRRESSERIDGFIRTTVAELGLRDPIARAGFDFEVGVAGSRLSGRQRRRLGLARGLIKRPEILLIDGVLDEDPDLLRALRDDLPHGTVIIGTAGVALARQADHVIVLRDARRVAEGDWCAVAHALGESEDVEAPPVAERVRLREAG